MSYSRWSHSRWYTYWSCRGGNTKETQMFSICGDNLDFTYKELKEDLEGCLAKVSQIQKMATTGKKPSIKLLEELKGYMLKFIEDVEEEYK